MFSVILFQLLFFIAMCVLMVREMKLEPQALTSDERHSQPAWVPLPIGP